MQIQLLENWFLTFQRKDIREYNGMDNRIEYPSTKTMDSRRQARTSTG